MYTAKCEQYMASNTSILSTVIDSLPEHISGAHCPFHLSQSISQTQEPVLAQPVLNY